jgi:hypothetical protein
MQLAMQDISIMATEKNPYDMIPQEGAESSASQPWKIMIYLLRLK